MAVPAALASLAIAVSGAGAAGQLFATAAQGGGGALIAPIIDGTLTDETIRGIGLVALFSLVKTFAMLAGALAWFWWFDRAWRNVEPLTGVRPDGGRVGAIGWWFVPFLGLWKAPRRVAEVARRVADPRGPGVGLVVLWASAFAAALVFDSTVPRLAAVLLPFERAVDAFAVFEALGQALTVVAALLAIAVIAVITRSEATLALRDGRLAAVPPESRPRIGQSVVIDHGPPHRAPALLPVATYLAIVAITGAIAFWAVDALVIETADAEPRRTPGMQGRGADASPQGRSPATPRPSPVVVVDEPVVARYVAVVLDPQLTGRWRTEITFALAGEPLFTTQMLVARSGRDHWSRTTTRPRTEPTLEVAVIGDWSYRRSGDGAWSRERREASDRGMPVIASDAASDVSAYLGRTRVNGRRVHRIELRAAGEEFVEGISRSFAEKGESPFTLTRSEVQVRDDGVPVRYVLRATGSYRGEPVEASWVTTFEAIGEPVDVTPADLR
jgi:hypothetical protein